MISDISNKLSPYQFGFKCSSSTSTNLLVAYDYLSKSIDKGKEMDVALFDLSKAFDKVDHAKLIRKLIELNVGNDLCKAIQNFLYKRYQYVKIFNCLSSMQNVTSGVPQGTILGPLLFSIYLNDIWKYQYNGLLLAFADDLKLIGPYGNCFQTDINNITNWVKNANIELNCDKC